jgi:CRISPR-associated protein Cas2
MYDISNDKIRNKVIKSLKKNGLYRIQKSVFIGSTHLSGISELQKMFEKYLEHKECQDDKYIIIPLDDNILNKIKLLNIKTDLALYLGKKQVYFI